MAWQRRIIEERERESKELGKENEILPILLGRRITQYITRESSHDQII